MEKVLQILVVLALLMLAVNYYIKADKIKFRPYYPAGRMPAPTDLLWDLPGMDPDNHLLFIAKAVKDAGGLAAAGNLQGERGSAGSSGDTAEVWSLTGNAGAIDVLDSDTGDPVAHIPTGTDPVSLVFDPETRLLYSASAEGTVSIFKQVSRDSYKLLQSLVTHPGCPLLALDTRTKKIWLPVTGSLPPAKSEAPSTDVSATSTQASQLVMASPAPTQASHTLMASPTLTQAPRSLMTIGIECWVFSNQ